MRMGEKWHHPHALFQQESVLNAGLPLMRHQSSLFPRLSAVGLVACGMALVCHAQEPPAATTPPAAEKGELPPLTRPLEQATVFARQATEAMRRADWSKAADMWQELLKLQPDSAAALSNLGAVEIQLKNVDAARGHLEKAVQLRPNLAAAWMTLGLLYNDQKNPMLAISALARGVHEDPSDARLHNALAIVLKQVGWMNGAEQELQRAIDLQPDYAEAHFNLALLFLDQRPPAVEMARRHYQKARDLGAAPDELVDKQLAEAAKENQAGEGKAEDKPGPVSQKEPEVKAKVPDKQAGASPKPASKNQSSSKEKPAPKSKKNP